MDENLDVSLRIRGFEWLQFLFSKFGVAFGADLDLADCFVRHLALWCNSMTMLYTIASLLQLVKCHFIIYTVNVLCDVLCAILNAIESSRVIRGLVI
jgi:hypothetical protein